MKLKNRIMMSAIGTHESVEASAHFGFLFIAEDKYTNGLKN